MNPIIIVDIPPLYIAATWVIALTCVVWVIIRAIECWRNRPFRTDDRSYKYRKDVNWTSSNDTELVPTWKQRTNQWSIVPRRSALSEDAKKQQQRLHELRAKRLHQQMNGGQP